MRFSTTAALLITSTALTLANPIPDGASIAIGPDDVLDDNTIEVDIGATIVVGFPAFIDLGTSPSTPLVQREPTSPTTENLVDLVTRARSKDQQNGMRLHNRARRLKGLNKLVWDRQLTADALAWAQQLAARGVMEHSSNESRPGQGENLAWAFSTDPIKRPISSATKMWLAEESAYHGEVIPQGNFAAYGHYTQCLWSTTTKIGIAVVADGKGAFYTVARYSPAGNIAGQKPY